MLLNELPSSQTEKVELSDISTNTISFIPPFANLPLDKSNPL